MTGEPRFLAIARIVRAQGRRGEVAAEITTDFPERFGQLSRVYLGAPEAPPVPCQLTGAWPHKGRIILKFSGIDSITDAEQLRGCDVLIPYEERFPLPENSYYWLDLMGCRVMRKSSQGLAEVGNVTGIQPTQGVALLEVTPPGPEREKILIPLAREICQQILPEEKVIVIEPPEDLLDLNE
ncbi:MAG: ribosome maturation factor RimM [Terriglobia bacterium]